MPTLRSLFSEFPELPEDILVGAQGDSALLNALRARDRYSVIYSVDGEYTAELMDPGVSMVRLATYLLATDLSDESHVEALALNGKTVRYTLSISVQLEEEVI